MPDSTEVITGPTQCHLNEPLLKVFLKVCLSYYPIIRKLIQLTEKAIMDTSYSPSYNEQLVEVISSDTLRIILTHLHKVIFNCLYQKNNWTLKPFLKRIWHLHLIRKMKVTWSLDWYKNEEVSPCLLDKWDNMSENIKSQALYIHIILSMKIFQTKLGFIREDHAEISQQLA